MSTLVLWGNLSCLSTYNAGDLDLISGLGRSPGEGHGNSLQYSCLENPHGERSLAGYSPRSRKESDTTQWLSTAQHSTTLFENLYISTYAIGRISLLTFQWCSKNTRKYAQIISDLKELKIIQNEPSFRFHHRMRHLFRWLLQWTFFLFLLWWKDWKTVLHFLYNKWVVEHFAYF